MMLVRITQHNLGRAALSDAVLFLLKFSATPNFRRRSFLRRWAWLQNIYKPQSIARSRRPNAASFVDTLHTAVVWCD